MKRLFILLAFSLARLFAQQTVDNSGAAQTIPFRIETLEPGACTVGEFYWNIVTTTLRVCSSPNTWANAATGGGSGIASLDTLTGSTQLFAFGSAGTTPNVVPSGSTHTFNFPLASTSGVTAGLIPYSFFSTIINTGGSYTDPAWLSLTWAGGRISGITPQANGGTGINNTATITLGTANHNWAILGTGIVKNTTTTGALSLAAYTDIFGLFTGCSGTMYPGFDGACHSAAGSGTVTSVNASFTGGILSVAGGPVTTSGTLAFTLAGTSGGIPYFSSTTGWASSALLAANAPVIGGGAGAAPSTIAVVNNAVLSTNGSGVLSESTTLPSGLSATNMTLVTPSLGAAAATSLLATGIVDGEAPVTLTTGASATLGGTYRSGYTFNQEATAATAVTYTLPTAAAGLQYCVANSYNGSAADTGTIELLTSASGQFIIFTDGTLSATGGYVQSAGAARDSACVVGVDSTHWLFYPSSGVWAKH